MSEEYRTSTAEKLGKVGSLAVENFRVVFVFVVKILEKKIKTAEKSSVRNILVNLVKTRKRKAKKSQSKEETKNIYWVTHKSETDRSENK